MTSASRGGSLFRAENLLNLLLVFVPVALALDYLWHAGAAWVFCASALAIVPLAGLMGKATESLAHRLGSGLGALLNATFGNAAELILAVIALRAGLHDLVKASITGSIIGNILLVFGISALAGGLKVEVQRFNRTAANLGATMLVLSAVALVVPAIFHQIAPGDVAAAEHELSFEISIVLVATYALSLVFSLKTHRHLYGGSEGEADGPPEHAWSTARATAMLVGATALVAWMSELLIGAVDETARQFGMSEVFVGVILVTVVGNAAEHSTAVLMALKDKMDLAINIAVGSSIQVALFVAPVLVFLSYAIGPHPMDLLFTTLEVVAVAVAVGTIALISQDGESNWMEGVQLLAVYLILGMAFYFLPVPPPAR
jgi:Ca2+:H+ antiporter